MSDFANSPNDNDTPGWFARVLTSDSTKKGVAAAAAGLLIAAVSETLWPSTRS